MRFFILIVATLFSISPQVSAEEISPPAKRAIPKQGKKIDPPLSENLPAGYEELPLFGSIAWEVQQLPWVEEGPYAGISGLAMASHAGRIYVSGGFIPGGDGTETRETNRTSRWTQCYDPKSNSWSELPNLPERREYTRGIVLGDYFYVMGGGRINQTEEPSYRPYADCFRINLTAKQPAWEVFASLNVPRTHMAVGSVGNKLLVIGGNEYDRQQNGYSHQTIRDTTELFDLDQPERGWQVRTPIPSGARGWTASVTDKQALYLFGGVTWKEGVGADRFNEAWCYHPDEDHWEAKAAAPISISGWEGALYNNRYAILAGGVMQSRDKVVTNSMVWSDLCWAYDLKADRWLRIDGCLPPGAVFNDPGVVIIDDKIYVLGAEGPFGSHYNYFLVGQIKPTSN
ncbi:MAG: hypothetical protein KDA65_05705 [Planctomycetaceae bacterium]|nr:hypothetical protein [Planctomycetaceae bacterium]